MNKRVLLLIIVAILTTLSANSKEVYKFNNNWKFLTKGSSERAVVIPHTWNNTVDNIGTYYRNLDIPESWSEKRLFLRFNGVSRNAELFVNNRFVGSHSGGFTSFTFDITPFTKSGVNQILLTVNNTEDPNTLPLKNEYYQYGGINRDIELIVADKNFISDTEMSTKGVVVAQNSVTDSNAEIDVIVSVSGMAGTSSMLSVDLFKGDELIDSKEVEANMGYNEVAEVIIPFSIKEPRLWDAKNDPFLYSARATLKDGTTALDTETSTFGLRYVEIDPEEGFLLNGKKYPLYGVVMTTDKFGVGSGYSHFDIEEDFKQILEIGATAVRTTPGAFDPYFYELCDIYGIVVWCDFNFTGNGKLARGFTNSYPLIANAEQQFMEMMYQYNNHPSIVMYGIFNKISSLGDNPVSLIANLNEKVKSFSPDRITVGTSIEDGKINYITDAIGWAQYFGWKNSLATDFPIWLNSFNDNWKDLSPAVAEFGAEGRYEHTQSSKEQKSGSDIITEENQTNIHTIHSKALNNPNRFWGYFVNSMFDYKSSESMENTFAHYYYYGLISYDRSIKKDAFYLYKANWNREDKFVHIAGRRKSYEPNKTHDITIFSNCDIVELKLNGVSLGVEKVVDGTVTWKNISLEQQNRVTAIGDNSHADTINIESTANR